ncbi:DUF1700 domain-containing protein [Staphylococcus caprae]|uniref:DUF1700 domain-containing protein n=1 Tax=Staphylococcus caprae TaxID=29380 RepID=UPI000E689B00|nr:DUF1700 domain-containing protein [Staphylococcus caprae]MBU5272251.1 DUF1700 domain-containing protein [Staphylococcus caprae]RIM34624.1 DUF1700 domain-containing protein [Staphylococcus caprae]
MNKDSYLKILKSHLKHIDSNEKDDILNEYETHFYSGKQEGKSEEQIAHELGNPKVIAKELNATAAVERAHNKSTVNNITSAIIAVMGLSILNFFVILVPAVMLFFFIFTLIVFTISALAAPIMLIVKGCLDGFNSIILYDVFMAGLMLGIGLMLVTITFYIIKWVYILTVKYLKWNVSIVKGSVQA